MGETPICGSLRKDGKESRLSCWIDTSKGDEDAPNYRSRLVARESSGRLLFLDAAALMPLRPDGALDRAWTFDYVHLTNEMYTRYGEALLEVLRPFVQPR